MPLIWVLALFTVLIFADYIPMLRKGAAEKKTVWFYSVCLAVSFALLVLSAFEVDIPGLSDLISYIVNYAAGLNFN